MVLVTLSKIKMSIMMLDYLLWMLMLMEIVKHILIMLFPK